MIKPVFNDADSRSAPQAQRSASISPPQVIRGLNCQKVNNVGVHWLRMSFNYSCLQEIVDILGVYFGGYVEKDYGLWAFDRSFRFSDCDACVYFDSTLERSASQHRSKFTVELTGSCLELLSGSDLFEFIRSLVIFSPSCSRLDLYFDDNGRSIVPNELIDIIKRGDFTKFRTFSVIQKFKDCALSQDQVNFGTRGDSGSGRYLRVYDKMLESDCDNKAIRWELELTKQKSRVIFRYLSSLNSESDFLKAVGSFVGGSIDFVYRGDHQHISRMPRYSFWQNIINILGRSCFKNERKSKSMDDVKVWFKSQIAPSLAMIRESYSEGGFEEFCWDMVDDGKDRWNNKHMRIMAEDGRAFAKLGYKMECVVNEL